MTALKKIRRRSVLAPVPNAKSHNTGSNTNPALLAAANATNVTMLAGTKKVAKSKEYISRRTNARQHVPKEQSISPQCSANSVVPTTRKTWIITATEHNADHAARYTQEMLHTSAA
ncbi:MAG: hypothetical protein WBM35_02450 [Candidatus Electrothrix sp.]